MEEDKKEFEKLCEKYGVVFNYEIHKPFHVLTLILVHQNPDVRETIPYTKYFKQSLFNNNSWI